MSSDRLPNGEVTSSEERYVTAWRAFADRVDGLLGGSRVSYDPGLTLMVGKEVVDLPQRAAERLHAAGLELEAAGLAPSRSEARRLVEQGGVSRLRGDGALRYDDPAGDPAVADGDVLRVGKRRFRRLRISS